MRKAKREKRVLPAPATVAQLEFHPVTPQQWHDFEKLFGQRGACGGCWCMWWRLKRSEFEKRKGLKNKHSMRKIIASGSVPGILAYADNEPVGWCSIGPRQDYPVLQRSPNLKAVDDRPVWSVVCLFIARPYRKIGISVKLLEAAAEYAGQKGAVVLEGYPFDLKKGRKPWADAFVWTGLASSYRKAGFVEVLRRSPTRPIMRRYLQQQTNN